MPGLLLWPAVDLSGPITTPPELGVGTVTQFPATVGAWRVSLEIAEPPGVTWYDITQFYVGDRYQRGADDYKGKYRAALATVQLQIDSNQAADLGVSADILAPWGQDTTDLFGDNVRIGAGLLMRLSMVREVGDLVAEWLPIWTGRVELWGDASAARGQVRTHIVSVVDLLADLTNVPVELPDSPPTYWPEWFTEVVLPGAGWLFGVDVYGDLTSGGVLGAEELTAAINRMDQAADPLGLVWRTLRSGRMVIHPAPWDTTHTNRYENPLLDVYPDGLVFSYSPDFTDVEYITDDDQQPFGISRSVAGVLNSFVVSWPDGFDTFTYPIDDPVSSDRYGIRPFTAAWITPGNGEAVVDDLLASRAYAESQALPLRTTIDHEGFWTAMALIDHLDPVTVYHATSDDGLVVTGTGTVRNIVEERTVRGDGLLNWQSTIQIDIDSAETSEPLLPVEDLALVSTSSSLLGAPSTATFSWTNPTQPSITPTEVQYRMLGRSLIWLPKSYPGVGADGLVTYGLNAATRYTFQVRLVRRVDGIVTNFSAVRQVTFTTPAIIYPIPVPGDDPTDTNVDMPPFDDCVDDVSIELQENDGTGWVTVDTFSGAEIEQDADGHWHLVTDLPNSSFNDGSMYRYVGLCGGDIIAISPEFDPPDDWTDPCPTPAAYATAPYDSALVYVPKVCTGAEDGDPDFVFQGMQIIEAVSGIPGVPGDALDEIITGLTDPTDHALLAIPDPEWSDTPAGIVAYGECPQIIGKTGDKTISCKVNIADDVDCVLFECAGMRITCNGVAGQWRPGVTIYKVGSTISLAGTSLLNLGTAYTIKATSEYATGDIVLYVDDLSDNSVGGTDNVATITALPIWRAGVPPESWITDCALWDFIGTPIGVTIEQAAGQDDPTLGAVISFDIEFEEAVEGFATGDVTLSGSAPGALVATVTDTGDHIHYTAAVSGMTGPGTVTASILAGKATSIATGNPNKASTSVDNTVTYLAGTSFWWDTSYAADVTVAVSGGVDFISSLAEHNGGPALAQGTANRRPVYGFGSAVGSVTSSGNFDGDSSLGDYLTGTVGPISGAHTVFMVVDVLAGGATQQTLFQHGASVTFFDGMRVVVNSSTGDLFYNVRRTNQSEVVASAAGIIGTGGVVLTFRSDGTHANQTIRKNGSALTVATSGGLNSNVGAGSTGSVGFTVSDSSASAKMDWGALSIYDGALSDDTCAAIEAALMDRYGI